MALTRALVHKNKVLLFDEGEVCWVTIDHLVTQI